MAVGIGTALADDPQLTARIEGVARQPRRVVFDSEARLPVSSKLVQGVAEVPVTVVCSRAAGRTAVQSLESAGVDVIVATGQNERARVENALDELGAREVQSLLLEGGPHLAGAFLEAGEIDEARVFVAPLMTGGRDAKTAVEGMGFERIDVGAASAARRVRPPRGRPARDRATEGMVRCSRGSSQARGRFARSRTGGSRSRRRWQPSCAPGDSIAVNGVCLTAREPTAAGFSADVMPETLRRSSLGPLGAGDAVNLELPLRAGDRLGGHIVQGHVDGTGEVAEVREEGFSRVVRIAAPADLLRYVVEKGSIAVDGVSLTVSAVDDEGFEVSLIPETLERTTLGSAAPGRAVNLEVDLLAKYVEKDPAHSADRALGSAWHA